MEKSILILLILLTHSSAALAQGNKYFGIQYAAVNSDAEFDDWDTGMVFGRVGMEIQPGLAAEGYVGLGIQDDESTTASGCDSQKVSTDSIIGAQIKASTDVENVNLHANIGLNMVSASIEISGAASCYGIGFTETYDDSEIGVSYGFGANFKITEKSAITADFAVFYDDTYSDIDLTIAGLLIGYQQGF